MSHIVKIETQVRDLQALVSACDRMRLAPPVQRTVKLYASEATGYAVQLDGWNYPVVFDLSAAKVAYDNFEGRWKGQT